MAKLVRHPALNRKILQVRSLFLELKQKLFLFYTIWVFCFIQLAFFLQLNKNAEIVPIKIKGKCVSQVRLLPSPLYGEVAQQVEQHYIQFAFFGWFV